MWRCDVAGRVFLALRRELDGVAAGTTAVRLLFDCNSRYIVAALALRLLVLRHRLPSLVNAGTNACSIDGQPLRADTVLSYSTFASD